MKIGLACLLLAALIAPAWAIDDHVPYDVPAAAVNKVYSRHYYDCIGASRAIAATMEDCIAAERQRLQPRLAAAYSAAFDRVADGDELGRRHAAWIERGGDYCQEEAISEGDGSAYALLLESCLLEEIAGRIAWLEQL